MMKSLSIAAITFLVTMTTSAFAMNFTSMKQNPAARVSGDTEIFKFILGDWKVSGGSCLSSVPVFWGGNFSDFEFTMHFNSDLNYTQETHTKGQLTTNSTGSFSVSQGLLSFHQVQTCTYEPNQQTCLGGGNDYWTTMVSIQGNQLWLLLNMGAEPGSCPAHD
ncbi:MAG: hypothetical protein ACXVB1_15100, partial [Pseudobdellovibrionaceae bacterium]